MIAPGNHFDLRSAARSTTPDWLGVILVYGIYLLIHALPYLPGWFAHRKAAKRQGVPAE